MDNKLLINHLEDLADNIISNEELITMDSNNKDLLKMVLGNEEYQNTLATEKQIIDYQNKVYRETNQVTTDYSDEINDWYLDLAYTVYAYIKDNLDSNYIYC